MPWVATRVGGLRGLEVEGCHPQAVSWVQFNTPLWPLTVHLDGRGMCPTSLPSNIGFAMPPAVDTSLRLDSPAGEYGPES